MGSLTIKRNAETVHFGGNYPYTYSDEIERDMGDAGEYDKRIIWRRLGHARNWIFKLRTWSPNPMVLKGAYARLYGER